MRGVGLTTPFFAVIAAGIVFAAVSVVTAEAVRATISGASAAGTVVAAFFKEFYLYSMPIDFRGLHRSNNVRCFRSWYFNGGKFVVDVNLSEF